ncbi:MAG: hypothetical protein ABJR05_11065 [Balneola sp.]
MTKQATYLLNFLAIFLIASYHELPDKGVPPLKNYKPVEYNHQGKIWAIDTAPNGIVYMSSDKSLLEYDGEKWKNYKGSDGITRSLLVKNDSLIYTGSDLDFGVWKRNKYQDFKYESLYPFKEDLNQINEEFWNVHSVNENILFVSASNIYVYRKGNLTKIPAPSNIESSFIINDVLHFVDKENGLFQLKDLAPKHLFHFKKNLDIEIVGLYAGSNQNDLILVTKKEGLFEYRDGNIKPLRSQLSQNLKSANVFSFERIDDSYLAFGTILKGLFISDLDGNIIHKVNKDKGLQNNTILSLHHNRSGKLWLSMDYGVSSLDLSNEFTFFYDYSGTFGTGYSAVLKDEFFYLGTNQGLYRSKWDDLNNESEFNALELIPETEGQVWTLKNIDDQIWIGHDRGLFVLDNKDIKQISSQQGFWIIQPYKEYLLGGTYNGISIFEKKEGKWTYLKQMELILGSCNQILIEDENILWVNIPNYGIIKAYLNEELYPENRQIFLSEQFKDGDHRLLQDENGIYVTSGGQNYIFDSDLNKFVEENSRDSNSKIEDLLLGNAEPVQLNSEFEFHPIYNGFALKNLRIGESTIKSKNLIVFREITAFNNDGSISVFNGAEIPYKFNNLRIEGIIPNRKNVLYQSKLSENGDWSEWTKENTFELIGLEPGDYVFHARAQVNGVNTKAETIWFNVATPWYKSPYIYALYFCIALLSIYLFYQWRKVSMNKLKKELLINQQNSLREQGERYRKQLKQIEEIKRKEEYELLKEQLKRKTIELATKAKENEEINKVLQSLKEKFLKLEKNPDSFKSRTSEIKKIIDSHLSDDDNTFEIQMDELHQRFFEKLRQDFPELTSYDLRLCAYIKLGFNSKEIANMLSIMPSSVYISRSRVRKKLDLGSDKDLHTYLNSI